MITLTPHRFLSMLSLQISWGTKQDTVVETDLGALIQTSDSQVDVEVHADSGNDLYDHALNALRERIKRAPKKAKGGAPAMSTAEREQAAKDYYASVRTNVSVSLARGAGVRKARKRARCPGR